MKNSFKAVVVGAGVIIMNMIIHIVCNMNGIELDSVVTGSTSAVLSMFIYQAWIRSEKTKEDQE